MHIHQQFFITFPQLENLIKTKQKIIWILFWAFDKLQTDISQAMLRTGLTASYTGSFMFSVVAVISITAGSGIDRWIAGYNAKNMDKYIKLPQPIMLQSIMCPLLTWMSFRK